MDKNNSIKKRTTAALLAVQICVMALVGCTIGNGNKTGTLTPGSSILPAPKKSIKEASTNASQEITVTGVLSYIDRDNKKANFIDISSGVEYEEGLISGQNTKRLLRPLTLPLEKYTT